MSWRHSGESPPESDGRKLEFYTMGTNAGNMDIRFDRLESGLGTVDAKVDRLGNRLDTVEAKVSNIGQAVRVLQRDMGIIKRDISWFKWVFSVSVPVVLAIFVYLFTRQDTLNGQIIELLQQIANK